MRRLLFYCYFLLVLAFACSSVSSFQQQHGRSSILRLQQQQQQQQQQHPTTATANSSSLKKKKNVSSLSMSSNNNNDDLLQKTTKFLKRIPVGSLILILIGVRSSIQLFDEVPKLLGEKPDFVGTAFDVFFVGYAIQNILQQTGLVQQTTTSSVGSISNTECCVTLNVGREQNTLMERNWAASGKRLLLPINIRFTDDELDLGFPGEEALGGRYCKQLTVLNQVSFVGPEGEIKVPVVNGGWTCLPMKNPEESKLRFFLDFPTGAFRNDVYIPPKGRVFFSGVCFDSNKKKTGGEMIFTPDNSEGGGGILQDGGLTMKKKNGIRNLYGSLGNINLIIGRYQIGPVKSQLL